jgi:hypothetical protein
MVEQQQAMEAQQAIEKVLTVIIDEWYNKVSSFYVTAEAIAEGTTANKEEELKRFHDGKGHRIKFSKEELDFTYGLRSYWENDDLHIEVSVNNKVRNFDINQFRSRLAVHFQKAGQEFLPTPAELRNRCYSEIFELDSNFDDAFKLELRDGKADIMRLSFRLNRGALDKLVARPVSSKELVENYCVTPFRNIYASVYRQS